MSTIKNYFKIKVLGMVVIHPNICPIIIKFPKESTTIKRKILKIKLLREMGVNLV